LLEARRIQTASLVRHDNDGREKRDVNRPVPASQNDYCIAGMAFEFKAIKDAFADL
jgi:hypothetical protein